MPMLRAGRPDEPRGPLSCPNFPWRVPGKKKSPAIRTGQVQREALSPIGLLAAPREQYPILPESVS
jgi:hypothetical protein